MINTLEDLRPGDILLGPIGGAVGLGVAAGQLMLGEGFRSGTLSIRHVGIVVQAASTELGLPRVPMLVQAMPRGAEEVAMRLHTHWTERHAYVRLPEDYLGQGEDAATVARLMVREGVDYSWMTYPALAGVRLGLQGGALERWVDRRRHPIRVDHFGEMDQPKELQLPQRAICSRLVDYAWSCTGMKVLEGTRRGVATPGMMADQFSQREGATWCRPRPARGGAKTWVI